jgi:hypothetical protein
MLDIEYRMKISQFLANPAKFRPAIREALKSSRMIVVEQEEKEMPVLTGKSKDLISPSPIHESWRGDYYTVNTSATNNGFFYPLAVARGTGRFRGSRQDFPSFGRVRSGESKQNRGSGGIRPNMFDIRAKIGAEPLLKRHFIVEIRREANKMIESNNG